MIVNTNTCKCCGFTALATEHYGWYQQSDYTLLCSTCYAWKTGYDILFCGKPCKHDTSLDWHFHPEWNGWFPTTGNEYYKIVNHNKGFIVF